MTEKRDKIDADAFGWGWREIVGAREYLTFNYCKRLKIVPTRGSFYQFKTRDFQLMMVSFRIYCDLKR